MLKKNCGSLLLLLVLAIPVLLTPFGSTQVTELEFTSEKMLILALNSESDNMVTMILTVKFKF